LIVAEYQTLVKYYFQRSCCGEIKFLERSSPWFLGNFFKIQNTSAFRVAAHTGACSNIN